MASAEESQIRTAYEQRLPSLQGVCEELYPLVASIVRPLPRIDRVTARPKHPDRFIEKAFRLVEGTTVRKYPHPLEEIQDQVGLRVVVHYKSDVQPVRLAVLREFAEIEDIPKEQPRPDMFGYEAHHFVCMIPLEVKQKHGSPIEFFELQVSTLFQHAWAEANHQLGYKASVPLAYDQRRRIAWAASQAWGADEIFDSLWAEFRPPN